MKITIEKVLMISFVFLFIGFISFVLLRAKSVWEYYDKDIFFEWRTKWYSIEPALIKDKETGNVRIENYIAFNYTNKNVNKPEDVPMFFNKLKELEFIWWSWVKIPEDTYYAFWHYLFFNKDLGVGKVTDVCHWQWSEDWQKYKRSDAFVAFGNTEEWKKVVEWYDKFCNSMNNEDLMMFTSDGSFQCDKLKHDDKFYTKCILSKNIDWAMKLSDYNKFISVFMDDELIWSKDYWYINLSWWLTYVMKRFSIVDKSVKQCVDLIDSKEFTNEEKAQKTNKCFDELLLRWWIYKFIKIYNQSDVLDKINKNEISKDQAKTELQTFLEDKLLK